MVIPYLKANVAIIKEQIPKSVFALEKHLKIRSCILYFQGPAGPEACTGWALVCFREEVPFVATPIMNLKAESSNAW